jgi:hypothetical protein
MDLGKLIMGTASLLAGAQALREAFSQDPEAGTTRIGPARVRPIEQLDRLDDRLRLSPKSRLPSPSRLHAVSTNGKRELPVPKGMKTRITRVRNINERVKHLVPLIQSGRAHPSIRALSVQAVSKKCSGRFCLEERDYPGEVRAVFDFVRQNVRYVKDGIHADQFHHPVRTLQFGGGDCDDMTVLLGSMLQAIGYPVKMRVIQTVGAPDWNHIYLLVGLPPGEPRYWVALDASVDKPAGWAPPRQMIKRVKDFDVP